MKEVDLIPDDPTSAECIKQLEQVLPPRFYNIYLFYLSGSKTRPREHRIELLMVKLYLSQLHIIAIFDWPDLCSTFVIDVKQLPLRVNC